MNEASTISFGALAMILSALVGFWAIMSGVFEVWKQHRDNRILLLAICRHLDINVEEIIGKQ